MMGKFTKGDKRGHMQNFSSSCQNIVAVEDVMFTSGFVFYYSLWSIEIVLPTYYLVVNFFFSLILLVSKDTENIFLNDQTARVLIAFWKREFLRRSWFECVIIGFKEATTLCHVCKPTNFLFIVDMW